jgi:dolichol kinase
MDSSVTENTYSRHIQPEMSVIQELGRKGIHLLMLPVPLSFGLLSRDLLIGILAGLSFLALILDLMRITIPAVHEFFQKTLGSLIREKESYRITGATWILISALLCIILFNPWISQTVLLWIIVADTLCAISGKIWGRHFIRRGKTWEGSAVFFVSSFLILSLVPDKNMLIGTLGIVCAMTVDLLFVHVNDNIAIPLLAGGIMQILCFVF